MILVFYAAVICVISGIGVQFDDMPINDGAGQKLAGIGVIGMIVVGGMMWAAA